MYSNFILVSCTTAGREIIKHIFKSKYFSKYFIGVINLNEKRGKKKSDYDNYNDLVKKYKFQQWKVDNINSKKVLNIIKENKVNLIFQLGWSEKFENKLLYLPKYGCIGMHPSYLPEGKGAAILNWAIIKGYNKWGVSYFRMDDKFDNGEILSQRRMNIYNNDTIKELINRANLISLQIFKENINKWISGKFRFKKKNEKNKIINYVRALSKPYPGAFVIYKDKKIIIWKLGKKYKFLKKFRNNNFLFKYKKKLYLNVIESKKIIEVKNFKFEKV